MLAKVCRLKVAIPLFLLFLFQEEEEALLGLRGSKTETILRLVMASTRSWTVQMILSHLDRTRLIVKMSHLNETRLIQRTIILSHLNRTKLTNKYPNAVSETKYYFLVM